MSMSRKDFVVIAPTLFRARNLALLRDEDTTVLDGAIKDLCWTFSRLNPRFDGQKFLSACGPAP